MPVLSTDKVLATRDIIFYYKAYHASNRAPDMDVPWGTAWGTPSGQTGAYVDGGYTQGGLGFSAEISRTDIRMDQSLDPVLRPATGRTVNMTANLGEFDLDAVATATGQGSVTTVAPTTADPGYDLWAMGLTVADNFYTTAFDIGHPGDDMPVRVFGWYAQPTGAEAWNFSPEAAAVTPFNVSLFPDPVNGNRVASIYDIIPTA
jgi:hypothetical protein